MTQRHIPVAAAVIALPAMFVAGWLSAGTLHPAASRSAPSAAIDKPAVLRVPLVDHSALDDPSRLPEPDPSPAAVAAYGR